jgi:hypothetical protein
LHEEPRSHASDLGHWTAAVSDISATQERIHNVRVIGVDTVDSVRHPDRELRNRPQESPTWFRPALIGVVALGATVRIVFAISVMSDGLTADANFFHKSAADIANGNGYDTMSGGAAAIHPPIFPCLLAVFDLVGLRSIGEQRIVVSILASAGVLLVGLLGRKVAGAMVGTLAARIAALDPIWFQPSGILMSESVYLVVIPGILLMGSAVRRTAHCLAIWQPRSSHCRCDPHQERGD